MCRVNNHVYTVCMVSNHVYRINNYTTFILQCYQSRAGLTIMCAELTIMCGAGLAIIQQSCVYVYNNHVCRVNNHVTVMCA